MTYNTAVQRIIFFLLLATLVAFGASQREVVMNFFGFNDARENVIEAAHDALWGDIASASLQAEQAVSELQGDGEYLAGAQTVVETAKIWNKEREERLSAIRSTKDRFSSLSASPIAQAEVINQVLGYASLDRGVIGEIFSDGPFSSLRDTTDNAISLRNLAEYALTLADNSTSHFWVAEWHAQELRKSYDGARTLSDATRDAHVSEILRHIEASRQLFESELEVSRTLPFGQMYEPQFFFFLGNLYGALSLTDASFMQDSSDAFRQVVSHFEEVAEPDARNTSLFAARIPYALLLESMYMHEVGHEKYKTEIHQNLTYLVDMVRANPEIHGVFFLPLLRSIHTDPMWYASDWVNEKRLRSLATISDDFRSLLVENGWGM